MLTNETISPLILKLFPRQPMVPLSHYTVRKHQSFLPDFADQCQSVVVRVGGVYSEITFFRSIDLPLSLGNIKYIVH